MMIAPSHRPGKDVRVTHYDPSGNLLNLDLSWEAWDDLVAVAERLRHASVSQPVGGHQGGFAAHV
jgi:hypothetical protein